ncbi:MAG: DNA-directed RNA polymerase subunit H [Nitrososphaerota archaeon]|nr:DNA-directed RNA polymerase subunit H [Candidatus Calditenuaceae archaeon]MDW8073706.1 DNA-directed RNA polymerase subunit H [Nitrososphaerota archaeon]
MSILEHELVPRHEVMKPEEVQELLSRYRVTLNELPRILVSDPVVREIGAKPGDVLKISRRSPTAGLATYYRLVVREE